MVGINNRPERQFFAHSEFFLYTLSSVKNRYSKKPNRFNFPTLVFTQPNKSDKKRDI